MLQKGFVNVPLMVFMTLLLVTAGVFYIVGRSSVDRDDFPFIPQSSETPSTIINDTLSTPVPTGEWKISEVKPLELMKDYFKGYTVMYPATWKIVTRTEQYSSETILSKDNNEIVITQGQGDGSNCQFDRDTLSGQSAHFVNKKEIQKETAIWRRSQLLDQSFGPDAYSVCSKNEGSNVFTTVTHIGWIKIETPGSKSDVLMEVDQILEKISY